MYSLLFAFAALLLFDYYAFQGIKVLTSNLGNPLIKYAIHSLFWTLHISLPACLLLGVTLYRNGNKMPNWSIWAGNLFITLLVTQVCFILIFTGGDIVRYTEALIRYFTGTRVPGTDTFLPTRRKFVAQLAIAAASIPFTSLLYGITKGKYDYKVHRHVLKFKNLPEAFHGLTITQLSDFHAGSFDNPSAVQRGIELAKSQKSDLFVFTGDLVNNEATEFIPYVHLFNSIEAPLGKFSILGNHDYGDYWKWATKEEKEKNLDTLKELQQAAGFKLLLNESVKIEKNGGWIHLLGIENWGDGFAQYGDLEKTLAQVPDEDFKVLLSHDPSHFEYQIKKHPSNINLTLSGHTHGMQMGVEIPGFRWSPVQYRYPRWAGIYRENERILHVNRGFGFLGFRGRVGIWPEITVIELQREA